MNEQSFQNHAHRPTHTLIVWVLALLALLCEILTTFFGKELRGWAVIVIVLAVFELGWMSRTYIVKLQDRIIMLEVKVRAAELLTSGQDAQLATLSAKQIAALRFAGDAEFGSLLDRAARENMTPQEIKASIKNWRPDRYRT